MTSDFHLLDYLSLDSLEDTLPALSDSPVLSTESIDA